MDTLVVALFLVVVANRLVEALIVPVFDKFKLDKFVVQYIAWAVGSGLVWLSGVNLFPAMYLPDPLAGQILTAAVAGGGATLLHDIFDGSNAIPLDVVSSSDDLPCCEADDDRCCCGE